MQQQSNEINETTTQFDYAKAQNKFLDQVEENLKLNSLSSE